MKKNNYSIYKMLILVSGVLAFAMAFLPTLIHTSSESVFKGFELVLGKEFIDLGSIASGQIEPNIFIGIAYLLPIIACILAVTQKKGAIIAFLLFIVSAVLLFLIPEMTVATVTVLGNTNEIDVEWTMAYGLYFAIGLTVIGAFLSIIQSVTNSSKN